MKGVNFGGRKIAKRSRGVFECDKKREDSGNCILD
jgi:hypothetical protein